jgi:hypothetical protein
MPQELLGRPTPGRPEGEGLRQLWLTCFLVGERKDKEGRDDEEKEEEEAEGEGLGGIIYLVHLRTIRYQNY